MSVAAEMFWDEYRPRYGSAAHGLSSLVVRLFVIASASVAANIFLFLAVGAFNRSEWVLRSICRARFVLDVVVAVTLTAIPPEPLVLFRVPFMFLFRVAFPH